MDTAHAPATPPPRARKRFTDPILVRLSDASGVVGVSEAALRAEIKLGRLEARRMGRAVLVPVESLRRWSENLPAA